MQETRLEMTMKVLPMKQRLHTSFLGPFHRQGFPHALDYAIQ
jgi:hypothetical protein